eukprot:13326905-Alexandrium_andersonii.AAC.1
MASGRKLFTLRATSAQARLGRASGETAVRQAALEVSSTHATKEEHCCSNRTTPSASGAKRGKALDSE